MKTHVFRYVSHTSGWSLSTDTLSQRLRLLIHALSYSVCLKGIKLMGQIFGQTATKYNNSMSNLQANLFWIHIVSWFYSGSLKLHGCGNKAGTYFT